MRIRDDGALKNEILIDAALYYYRSRRWWPYQFVLDKTESLRHALGLRMVNRLRITHFSRGSNSNNRHSARHAEH